MANPGLPEPAPGGDSPLELPPRPYPGERPLGSDEPSAPFEEPPIDDPVEPGIGPDPEPGTPTDPERRT
ncbi:hypothetical protein G3T14_11605 [Methylobacterium sp. BTF04]|uniref:hypothetical protein n=1 Tax=Methylobacterium sp. BTF04 TaxID=2708300 RepID=UPI0013D1BCE9|nr:hypothetical protein [Methylobacterium sp. BTF04]NEU12777.1 hypothetical protein [Methylobacterium sp. BTF04]